MSAISSCYTVHYVVIYYGFNEYGTCGVSEQYVAGPAFGMPKDA